MDITYLQYTFFCQIKRRQHTGTRKFEITLTNSVKKYFLISTIHGFSKKLSDNHWQLFDNSLVITSFHGSATFIGPPRLPDMSACDIFFWGHLKSKANSTTRLTTLLRSKTSTYPKRNCFDSHGDITDESPAKPPRTNPRTHVDERTPSYITQWSHFSF